MSRCCIGAQGDCYELGKTIYIKRDEAVYFVQLRPFCLSCGTLWPEDSHGGKQRTDYFPLLLRRLRRPSAEAISRPIGRGSEERRRILEG